MPKSATGRRAAVTERTPIYFSHSYRARDRRVNEFFWQLFWEAGLTVSVDPKSPVLSLPYLEFLMKRSAGYAAVVTLRPEQKPYRCSPYVLYEYGLAVLARKPRLLFVEADVSSQFFAKDDAINVYASSDIGLQSDRQKFADRIREFNDRVRPYRTTGQRLRGTVGILIDRGSPAYAAIDRIVATVREAGFTPELVSLDVGDLQSLMQFDAHDLVVIDLDPSGIPQWVYPFLHGRFIPSIRLLHVQGDGPVALPPLIASSTLRGLTPVDEPVLYWRDPDLLIEAIGTQLARVEPGNRGFDTIDEGVHYFRRAGRRDASIFISNAGEANDFAGRLARRMKGDGMNVYQYQEANRIAVGKEWKPGLKSEVISSEIFLMLITKGYRNSEPSMMEYQLARESGADIIPVFQENVRGWEELQVQGIPLGKLDHDQRIEKIVTEVDQLLLQESHPRPRDRQPVDIAFITVLRVEFEAVRNRLKDARQAPIDEAHPNNWGWQLGEIESPNGRYRAVLAFAGQAGTTTAGNVTRATVDRWRPKYVVLVGIAGGMPIDGLQKGDVVVSKLIWEYEYGKIDGGFEPRVDLMYACEGRLVRSAEILPVLQPQWSAPLSTLGPTGATCQPKVRVGIVGSGNKVIDDLGDAFFSRVRAKVPKLIAVEMEGAGVAAAVREMHSQYGAEFVMIRGISDMPPAATGAAAVNGVSTQTAERDRWKALASEAAALFAVQWVSLGWPAPPRS